MSYTAKQWADLSKLSAKDLNELSLGIQEAHESMDRLEKIIPNLQTTDSDILKELKAITSGTSDAFSMLKDIKDSLNNDIGLSEILKQNSNNFLSKESQELSNTERMQVLKNLGLNKYTFLENIVINGNQITDGKLTLNIPSVDNQLNRNSYNAISNSALVQALENIGTSDTYHSIAIHNESYTSHQDIREALNSKATYSYVQTMIESIPTPDVSGQISDHNTDPLAHNDIRELIQNIDLSGYSKTDHNHDNRYSLIHDHPYAPEIHYHDYASIDYVDNKFNNIPTPDVSGQINAHNTSDSSHQDIRDAINNIDLSGYSPITHNHDNVYSKIHSHPYAPESHSHDYLPLNGGTLTGDLKVGDSTIQTNGYLKGTWLYTSAATELGSTPTDIAVLSSGWIYKRSLANLKVDLGVPTDYAPKVHTHDYATQSNIDTAISNLKSWLLGAGNADTIDTIKDIADIMEEHKDVLDTLANTYASKNHDHDSTYLKLSGGTVTGNITIDGTTNSSRSYYSELSLVNSAGKPSYLNFGNDGLKRWYVYSKDIYNFAIGGTYGDALTIKTSGGTPEVTFPTRPYCSDPNRKSYFATMADIPDVPEVETTLTNTALKVPTSSAVKSFVEGKGYTTASGHNHDSTYLKLSGGNLTGEVVGTAFVGRLKGSDTRSANSAPSAYQLSSYTISEFQEFKTATTISAPNANNKAFTYLKTIVPWGDNSGGLPMQVSYGDGIAYRNASSDSAWGSWYHVPKVLKGTSSTQSSNTTSVKTLRFGLSGSTLYIWTS